MTRQVYHRLIAMLWKSLILASQLRTTPHSHSSPLSIVYHAHRFDKSFLPCSAPIPFQPGIPGHPCSWCVSPKNPASHQDPLHCVAPIPRRILEGVGRRRPRAPKHRCRRGGGREKQMSSAPLTFPSPSPLPGSAQSAHERRPRWSKDPPAQSNYCMYIHAHYICRATGTVHKYVHTCPIQLSQW